MNNFVQLLRSCLQVSFRKAVFVAFPLLLNGLVSTCLAEATFTYNGYVESVYCDTINDPPPFRVGAAGTLYFQLGRDTPFDQNPDPNIGLYGGYPETDYILSDYFYFKDNGSNGSFNYVTISNTPTGDSVYICSEANDSTSSVGLSFADASGNALTSDVWTEAYERVRWQTIAFDFFNNFDGGCSYTVRIPVAEAENLALQAKSPISSGTFADSLLCAGAGTFVTSSAPGQFITYTVPVYQPGNYVVRVGLRTSPNKGKFQLAINGINNGGVQDEYSSVIDNGFRDVGLVTFFAAGDQAFKFTVAGRNPSSTNYRLAFDYIDLIPTNRRETELLQVQAMTPPPAGIAPGQWSGIFSDPAASGGAGTYFKAIATSQFITYTMQVAKAGTYAVKVGVQTKPNKGKFQLRIDGVKRGLAQDEYSSSVQYGVRDLGAVYLTAGSHAFKFSVAGKNASSTGYTLAFDYIELVP